MRWGAPPGEGWKYITKGRFIIYKIWGQHLRGRGLKILDALQLWVGAKYFRRVAKEGAKKDISQLRGAPPSWT